jgi:predicted nucleotidyltransferase
MEKALKVISEMHKEGVLKEYAIGGAIATIYYTEPFATNDVDIFFIPPEERGLLVLTPFYEFCTKRGYKTEKEYILIGETPIQFLPAATALEKEAVQHATPVKYKNIQVNILRPEYLIAIFLHVFRLKDREKIIRLLEQSEINKKLLSDILSRHGLKGKFENFIGE